MKASELNTTWYDASERDRLAQNVQWHVLCFLTTHRTTGLWINGPFEQVHYPYNGAQF